MKINIKAIVAFLVLISSTTMATAQQGNFTKTATLGLSTPILDNGLGVHIGFNPAFALLSRLSVEGQLSYNYSKIKGSFISGEKGEQHIFNALVGGRLYIVSEEKRIRPYINLLIGGMSYIERSDSSDEETAELGLGFSTGAFLEINRFLVGLSYETLGNTVLKVGYTF